MHIYIILHLLTLYIMDIIAYDTVSLNGHITLIMSCAVIMGSLLLDI